MEHKDLSQGSTTPQRSSYVLVVEVTTNVGVTSTSLPLSKQPQRSLELSSKKSRVIQTSQGSSTRWKLLGDASPARGKSPRVTNANQTGLTKKSSAQACSKCFFSLNPLSNHSNPLGIEVGSKGVKRGEPRMVGGCFGRVFVAIN